MTIKASFSWMPLLLLAACAAAHTGPAGSATGATAGLRRSGDESFKVQDEPFKSELRDAARDWCAGGSKRAAVVAKYGRIQEWDVSQITDMSYLLDNQATCNPPISNWKVDQVTNMWAMFNGASKFNQLLCWDVAGKDTSSWLDGTSAAHIGPEGINDSKVCEFPGFESKQILQGAVNAWCRNQTETEDKFGAIREWDVSEVTDMSELFAYQDTCNPPIGKWNVSQVTNMNKMFFRTSVMASKFNQLLCWDTAKANPRLQDTWLRGNWLRDTAAALLGPGERSEDPGVCALNLTTQPFTPSSNQLLKYAARRWCSHQTEANTTFGPIKDWDVSLITDMSRLFANQENCNPPIGNWNVSQVTNMFAMFAGAFAFDQPLNSWEVGRVTNMDGMFNGASKFDQPLSNWSVSRVTNMFFMFRDASTFNQNISGWDICSVTDMIYMFAGATKFNQTLCWDTREIKNVNMLGNAGTGAEIVDGCRCAWKEVVKRVLVNNWQLILLGLAAAVLVAVLVTVDFEVAEPQNVTTTAPTPAPTPPPTLWEQIKTVLARVTGLNNQKLSADFDRRSSSSDSAVVQIHTASPTEAYTVIQALGTTSSATLTQMVVQQLQATNYTGSMPTMITTVIQSVTGSSNDSSSDNRMILIAVVVAAVCLLLVLLVIGGLVYLWKRNTRPAQPSGEPATPHQITMGSVGVAMNPMHAEHTKMQQ